MGEGNLFGVLIRVVGAEGETISTSPPSSPCNGISASSFTRACADVVASVVVVVVVVVIVGVEVEVEVEEAADSSPIARVAASFETGAFDAVFPVAF